MVQVRLRQIQFEMSKPDRSSVHVDGFIRDDPSLNRMYPAELSVALPTGFNYDASFNCYSEFGSVLQVGNLMDLVYPILRVS